MAPEFFGLPPVLGPTLLAHPSPLHVVLLPRRARATRCLVGGRKGGRGGGRAGKLRVCCECGAGPVRGPFPDGQGGRRKGRREGKRRRRRRGSRGRRGRRRTGCDEESGWSAVGKAPCDLGVRWAKARGGGERMLEGTRPPEERLPSAMHRNFLRFLGRAHPSRCVLLLSCSSFPLLTSSSCSSVSCSLLLPLVRPPSLLPSFFSWEAVKLISGDTRTE